ncbi:hypothetical protein E2C01_023556 [Portunus trituberculatus]|uniref:Uncharacterized protein n=1 Tax=Portunus trituberculatus TaxID=210409 RepID=A0A5B7EBW0_PORTR|nr:hypothetical protein [Portunus trituberculatus]
MTNGPWKLLSRDGDGSIHKSRRGSSGRTCRSNFEYPPKCSRKINAGMEFEDKADGERRREKRDQEMWNV